MQVPESALCDLAGHRGLLTIRPFGEERYEVRFQPLDGRHPVLLHMTHEGEPLTKGVTDKLSANRSFRERQFGIVRQISQLETRVAELEKLLARLGALGGADA